MAKAGGFIKALEDLIVEAPKAPERKLKVLMVSAEVAPYASVGGVASVIAYLSKALRRRGHDVRIFMPKFGFLDEDKYKMRMVHKGLEVPTGDEYTPHLICNVKYNHFADNTPTYFLENMEYYEKRANVYSYSDDPTRWGLLSRGLLEFIRQTKEFVPDVIHCNDWHTGATPNYLETFYDGDEVLDEVASVFTIHNLQCQGMFDHRNVPELDYDDGRSPVAGFFDERLNKQNFMRRAILYSDVVNTVSKTYAKEILTEEYGEGLDKLLMEVREKVFGIVDGIDYDELNPATDNLIETNYDIRSLKLRVENKEALQKEFDLPSDSCIPVMGFVGRLDRQKGVDLIMETLYHVMKDFDAQFVQVGGGDGGLTDQLHQLKRDFPNKVGIHPYPNFTLPRLLFAGCDMFLLPSRFEPCGIVQLEAMRYGAVPIVRGVGGLADTVENFDSVRGRGTGFVFKDFDVFSLFGQIIRALELYKNKQIWEKLQANAMRADFSWEHSAKEYERLYERAITLCKRNPSPRPKIFY